MKKNKENNKGKYFRDIYRILILFSTLILVVSIGIVYLVGSPEILDFPLENAESGTEVMVLEDTTDLVENGIHVRTGLIDADGLMPVVNNCTNCHSSELIIQNRMSAEGWKQTIEWMQETQNLWDLGANEKVIIDYLITNYPVEKKGRREVLKDIEWYVLKE